MFACIAVAFTGLWTVAIVKVARSGLPLTKIAKATEGVEPSINADRKIEAKVICEQFVSRRLKAPSSADFSWPHDTAMSGSGDGPYTVAGWVDAQNSFGAKIRSNYVCEVQATGKNWQRLSLTINGR